MLIPGMFADYSSFFLALFKKLGRIQNVSPVQESLVPMAITSARPAEHQESISAHRAYNLSAGAICADLESYPSRSTTVAETAYARRDVLAVCRTTTQELRPA